MRFSKYGDLAMSGLTRENSMTIEEMQKAIRAKGYQYVEHMFHPADLRPECMLSFSRSPSPHALTIGHDDYQEDLGWGRYERYEAWRRAYAWIVSADDRIDALCEFAENAIGNRRI